jgi:hypothetical protein
VIEELNFLLESDGDSSRLEGLDYWATLLSFRCDPIDRPRLKKCFKEHAKVAVDRDDQSEVETAPTASTRLVWEADVDTRARSGRWYTRTTQSDVPVSKYSPPRTAAYVICDIS